LDLMDESNEPPHDDSPTVQMVTAVTNATVTYGELLILNGGGRREKREGLELSLDRNVILLGKLLPCLRAEDLEMVTSVLRDIHAYRLHHPRSDPSNREQAEEARRVLEAFGSKGANEATGANAGGRRLFRILTSWTARIARLFR
jgi:hypothetical protein